MKKILTFWFVAAVFVCADEVLVQDGTVLNGTITSISKTTITLETGFAGTLEVEREQVTGFSVDNPEAVEEESVGQDPSGRHWKHQSAISFSGKSGNSDERRIGVRLTSELTGDRDELRLDGSYNTQESNGEKSSDRRNFGVRYTSYFNDPWGWYVRQEFQDDQFKNIQLRSMSALGLSYRIKEKGRKELGVNFGLNYRYERYVDNAPSSSNIGLDLGLEHYFGVDRQFEIHNELTIVPSAEDLTNYLISQDSYLDMPLTRTRDWKLRLGVENDYNSQPTGGRKKLDTRYYSSFVMAWE